MPDFGKLKEIARVPAPEVPCSCCTSLCLQYAKPFLCSHAAITHLDTYICTIVIVLVASNGVSEFNVVAYRVDSV